VIVGLTGKECFGRKGIEGWIFMDRLSKQRFFAYFLCLLLWFVPFLGVAQTPSGNAGTGPVPVALMVFVGDDLNIGAEFQEKVIGEVQNLNGYASQQVTSTQVPQSLNFPPDQPPEPVYLGDSRLVLTGEYYIDTDDLQHFQLWLWNSSSGSLVYTDEMVFEDMEEANGYLPPMVSWIFSHVPVEYHTTTRVVEIREEETAPTQEDEPVEESTEFPLFIGRFYLGLRGGGSFNAYSSLVSGGYEAGMSQGFSAGGAVIIEYRIFHFLGIQAEAIFNYDTFKVAKITDINATQSIRSTDKVTSMSLMIPLLIKVPLEMGKFVLSPFVGVYYAIPLGPLKIESNDALVGPSGSFTYTVDPPFGLVLGLDTGFSLGPGELFADLRFSRDVGMTVAGGGYGIQYIRNQIALSLGYRILLFRRR
jgi:hypothetical protein